MLAISSSPPRASTRHESNPPGPPTSPHVSQISSPPGSPPPVIRIPPMKRPRLEQRLYIDPPPFLPEQKAEYADIGLSVEERAQKTIQAILGKYEGDDGEPCYFARFSDGFVHRLPVSELDREQPNLVADYEQRKADGSLPYFDPSSRDVHPASRISVVLKLGGSAPKDNASRIKRKSDSPLTSLDSDSGMDSGETEISGYSEDDSVIATQRSRRIPTRANRTKDAVTLPFSPKKTRSRKMYIDEEDEDDEDELLLGPTRRSTRTKTSYRKNLDDAIYVDSGESEIEKEDDFISTAPQLKQFKMKKARPKASRPAYGQIRPVADLDYDSDEETSTLRAHRSFCEKCHREPTHKLLIALKRRKGKKKKGDDEDNDEERVTMLGGWVQCLKCPVAAHWGCLAKKQRDEILKAAFERDKAGWLSRQNGKDAAEAESQSVDDPIPQKRNGLDPDSTTEFICGSCMRGGVCMMCKQVALEPDSVPRADHAAAASLTTVSTKDTTAEDVQMKDGTIEEGQSAEKPIDLHATPQPQGKESDRLLFRCITCRRLAHYEHLPQPEPGTEYTPADLAAYYQHTTRWQCADCVSYVFTVEHILAWRPFPENAVEPLRPTDEPLNHKASLPREYLVKWVSRSYHRAQWVPHMWLVATHPSKLKNFLLGGSHVELLPEPAEEEVLEQAGDSAAIEVQDEDQITTPLVTKPTPPSGAIPDAERRIRPAWKTVDRVLDVFLWNPSKRKKTSKQGRKKPRQIESDDEEDEEIQQEYDAAFNEGEQPSADLLETVDEWEKRNKRRISIDQADDVVWAFIKWDELGYEDATWDSPPRKDSPGYQAFREAFRRFVTARSVTVPIRSAAEVKVFDRRPRDGFRTMHAFTTKKLPQLGQSEGLSLMPFQVDGVNWLCNNWWNLQHCILADEMGLGKTVQVVTFIGVIIQLQNAKPALVVVPNSTLTNWVREFERWAPNLRVCPFYGEAKAREVIKQYEMWHTNPDPKTTGAKYDVLVTSYETINGKEFGTVFKRVPRWEVLVVDEGQRLKSDSSLIFRKLRELKTIHRIILTGTPLNNNIRELFNLMNFLDPLEWKDLENLAKEHEVLTEESIKELHNRLRPYFLRRIKSEVLQLPPKNEVIVPVSMAPLQKEIYKSILSKNVELLKTLSGASSGTKASAATTKTNMNNILMELRKCLQHPYLVSQDIEPKGLSPYEAHEKLIDASGKLRVLRTLLPKLKARGHRVLLFSQFVIALNIVEDFLIGEGIKYLRLDGNTKQSERQKGMDKFNKPDSDIFIYLLTTRAGGVGINLWSADTVIIFDPDFNPHQDLQAIARAHRYGQQKTCLVFKLMVKDSAEERIMQAGKKKLVLDHLIVQKMDDDESKEDVQSILMFGAQTLFENEGSDSKDIHYSEHDIDNLITKTETEKPQEDQPSNNEALFSFAKVWSADKDSLEEISEDTAKQAEVDSWAQTLERIASERLKTQQEELVKAGRGVRRKAAAVFNQPIPEIPGLNLTHVKGKDKKPKKKGKGKAAASDDSDFSIGVSPAPSDSDTSSAVDETFEPPDEVSAKRKEKRPKHGPEFSVRPPLSSSVNLPSPHPSSPQPSICGLCDTVHEEGQCYMTESPENLAEYRRILLSHAGDETIDERRAAIAIIDETLHKLGKMHLVYGQPLHMVDTSHYPEPLRRPNVIPPERVPTAFMQNVQMSMQAAATSKPPRPAAKPAPKIPKPLAAQNVAPPAPTVALPSSAAPVTAAPPRPVPKPKPKPRVVTTPAINAVAGPSNPKRPISPRIIDAPNKRLKQNGVSTCVICGAEKHADIAQCHIIRRGTSARTQQEIARLRLDPQNATLVQDLTILYRKQKQKEAMAQAPDTIILDND